MPKVSILVGSSLAGERLWDNSSDQRPLFLLVLQMLLSACLVLLFEVLGMEPRAVHTLRIYFTIELHTQPCVRFVHLDPHLGTLLQWSLMQRGESCMPPFVVKLNSAGHLSPVGFAQR
jgi:hypothetical protein